MKKPLSSKSGSVRELTKKDISEMRPAKDVLPGELLKVLPTRRRGERGPQREPTKVLISLRISPEVVSYFKSTGDKWQTEINHILKEFIKTHPRNNTKKRA